MTVPISSSQIFKASLHYGQCTASCKTGHKGMSESKTMRRVCLVTIKRYHDMRASEDWRLA